MFWITDILFTILIKYFLVFIGFFSTYFYFVFIDNNYFLIFDNPLMFSLYGFILGYFSLWLINYIYKILYKMMVLEAVILFYMGFRQYFWSIFFEHYSFICCNFRMLLYFLKKDSSSKHIPLGSCLIIGSILYFS
ncbi:MAG: hypothetical protein CM15mP126_5380 [Gammaproteobacteria bacterium]|nr:MAG: hypothetical protein CM15mP126_5380 [Gammaproteobacteria bacterium]